jgi:hypothetical protein
MIESKKPEAINIGRLICEQKKYNYSITIYNNKKWNFLYNKKILEPEININLNSISIKSFLLLIDRKDISFLNSTLCGEYFKVKSDIYISRSFFVGGFRNTICLPFVIKPPYELQKGYYVANPHTDYKRNIRTNNKIMWFDRGSDTEVIIKLRDKKKKIQLDIQFEDIVKDGSNSISIFFSILLYFLYDGLYKATFLKDMFLSIHDETNTKDNLFEKTEWDVLSGYESLSVYEKLYVLIVYFSIQYSISCNNITKTETLKIVRLDGENGNI